MLAKAKARLAKLEAGRKSTARAGGGDYSGYRLDPVGYCRDVLGACLTPRQQEVALACCRPPHRVLVPSGHTVGKSYLAGCLVNWWFDTRSPSICLTTAPTQRQVNSILWREVRMLRGRHRDKARRGDFAGPKSPRLERSPEHFAEGFTARDGSRFQGHHSPAVMIVFDEAEGVDPIFWEAAATMLNGDDYCFLAIYNPTTQSSQAAIEERHDGYSLVRMSAVEHPNIAAEERGERPPYPAAVRLGPLLDMVKKWCTPIQEGEQRPGDIRLGGRWWRPGPVAQARLLGLRPSLAFDTIWSDAVFMHACAAIIPDGGRLQIGCDVARFGDDDTGFHVRKGGNSLYHERVNGWPTTQTAERCKQLADRYGRLYGIDARAVPIAVDDCGVGGGVVDQLIQDHYNAIGVNAGASWADDTEYPNLRSALWFGLADDAKDGNVSFARLDNDSRELLRREFTSPKYTLDVRGRRVAESKDDMKKRLGRSPDNADAVHLAYANVAGRPSGVAGRIHVPE